MPMEVIKRNGAVVPFDKNKIIIAIRAANKDLEYNKISDKDIQYIADSIESCYKDALKVTDKLFTVEDIQDLVEEHLMSLDYYDLARIYIKYRQKREMVRDTYKSFMDEVGRKINGQNIENQNANVDEASFGGRLGEASRVLTKRFALENCLSPMARKNHEENRIYVHDLDNYILGNHNCLSIPFDDLLAKGFNTRQTDIRPANSINTAFQLLAVIFQLQSLQQFGGVSATHLDWTMIPYVRKSFYKHYCDGIKYIDGKDEIDYSFHSALPIDEEDYKAYNEKVYKYAMDMTQKELKQAVEGMYHNLND